MKEIFDEYGKKHFMTHIRKMGPGREMDAAVAEIVMGWKILKKKHSNLSIYQSPIIDEDYAWFATADHNKKVQGPDDKLLWTLDNHPYGWFKFWRPSIDLSAAFDIVELADTFTLEKAIYPDLSWFAGISFPDTSGEEARAETATMAICLAAIKDKLKDAIN